jgi:hypothetical protein
MCEIIIGKGQQTILVIDAFVMNDDMNERARIQYCLLTVMLYIFLMTRMRRGND